eukprot:g3905.t1
MKHAHMLDEKISTGCATLDSLLDGGISRVGITEIVGSAGCGKTQLAMQLTVQVQLSRKFGGLEGSAAYICTEHSFPTERLEQLIRGVEKRLPKRHVPKEGKMTDRVHIVRVTEPSDVWDAMLNIPLLVKYRNVRLVIVDSIAAIFRGEYVGSSSIDMKERAQMMLQLSARMKQISREHGVAFVVTNQVTSVFDQNLSCSNSLTSLPRIYRQYADGHCVKPSLGLTWSNCVDNRIMIQRCRPDFEIRESTRNIKKNIRMMHVVFSSHLATSKCRFFCIEEDGVAGLAFEPNSVIDGDDRRVV